MTEHVKAWLGAYHDGELQECRSWQVEDHLAECATCRGELESLGRLTALLQQSPPVMGVTPPERFVAQVGLRLPRRPEQPPWQRALEIGWRLIPLGLLGAWAFAQTVLIVAGLVLPVLQMAPGGDLVAGLPPSAPPHPSSSELFGLLGASLGEAGRIILQLLGNGAPLAWGVTLNLASLILIGLLYWSWLASWWARRQPQQL